MAGVCPYSLSQFPYLHCYVQTFIRKNTVLLTTAFAGAFAFELAFDITSNKVWDSWNQGRQWKDIKHRYMVKEEEDDE
ncbi:hypothetical protein PENNAL_c0071G10513 [Penicillium nalgiovense]|uniref:Complex III subunit 9 n=1 Tax=Penicillium nalgiovense TaxID=60175 RepID=A0A1V6XKG8_PENNA|nr:hypothetical protein PENNAL_c0071G10513 [Penicillium nalgiovense]